MPTGNRNHVCARRMLRRRCGSPCSAPATTPPAINARGRRSLQPSFHRPRVTLFSIVCTGEWMASAANLASARRRARPASHDTQGANYKRPEPAATASRPRARLRFCRIAALEPLNRGRDGGHGFGARCPSYTTPPGRPGGRISDETARRRCVRCVGAWVLGCCPPPAAAIPVASG